MDFGKFFAGIANRRQTSLIRKWAKMYMENPSLITLANGMPNSGTFPFEEISVTYKGGNVQKFVGKELHSALQYGVTEGYTPLIKQMRDFQVKWHSPKVNDWGVIFTPGSQDAAIKVFEMILDIGDAVMVQSPCYGGTINALSPLLPEILEIEQDEHGIIPEQIFKVCSERLRDKKLMPKLLYVNPTGANPTGTVLPNSRRREIYKLAQKFDFLILEDDPYFFIDFSINKPVSFFEIDTDGRVIRLDSFSKILSAGIRLGVVTAHKNFIEKLTAHVESSCMHASSLSQMMLYKLLETWGIEKFGEHVQDVKEFYRIRRDVMVAAIEKHLTGLAEWTIPQGGMFVWIKVLHLKDVMIMATQKCVPEGVLILPGHAFSFDRFKPNPYIRLCYSYATPDEIEKAMSILAQVIRKEASVNNVN